MKRVLLYSIEKQYIDKIKKQLKKIEVRKRTLPKWALKIISHGESVEAYAYETIGKSFYVSEKTWEEKYPEWYGYEIFNKRGLRLISDGRGLVVVKFRVSGTTRYVDCSGCTNNENGYECQNDFMYLLSVDPELRKATCLTPDEIEEYGNGADLYAHHLTNIQPIDPMDIDEFYIPSKDAENVGSFGWAFEYEPFIPLKRAPQSFMTAYIKEECNNG